LLPFRSSIEGLESLLTQPVDVVVVMSRTFVDRIKNNLKKRGYKGTVLIIKELI
jgi:broad-specificity NMP kinase